MVQPVGPFAGRRVALVIGNSGYEIASRLTSPQRDAFAMGSLLERLGFEVQVATDCDYADFRARLRDFADRLDDAVLGLFYFSGHGVSGSGAQNHLLPVDADIREPEDLGRVTVPLQRVLDHMQAPGRVSLVFLDACHDDPFDGRGEDPARKGAVAMSPGLAAVAREAMEGTLVAFAADEGRAALDGGTGLSPFTRALTEALPMPGVEIRDIMVEVRRRVVEATDRRQQPWVKDKLGGQLVLVPVEPPAPQQVMGGASAGVIPFISRAGTPPAIVHAAPARSTGRVVWLPGLGLMLAAAAWLAIDDPRGFGCALADLGQCSLEEVGADRLAADLDSTADGTAAPAFRELERRIADYDSLALLAVLDRLEPATFAGLSAPGRERTISLLASVSASRWQYRWREIELAHARISGLMDQPLDDVRFGFDRFRQQAAWFDRSDVVIYTQFVGYPEGEAAALVDFLNTRFGWQASPPSPVGYDDLGGPAPAQQVRYNPASPVMDLAARLLRAEIDCDVEEDPACRDLVFRGQLPFFDVVPERSIPVGQIEIWIAR